MSDSSHLVAERPMRQFWPWCTGALAGAIVVLTVCCPTHAVQKKYWELSPYTIHIQLAVDDSVRSRPELDTELAAYLEQRILRTLHPLWSAKLEVAQGRERHRLLDSLPTLDDLPTLDGRLTEQGNPFDKRMFLTAMAGAEGYTLACREWDKYTRLWGPVLSRNVRQELMLPEQCFALLRSTFAPLATVRTDSADEKRATLIFKGSELPPQVGTTLQKNSGIFFRPATYFNENSPAKQRRDLACHFTNPSISSGCRCWSAAIYRVAVCDVYPGICTPRCVNGSFQRWLVTAIPWD
ncbi:MAG: hypothetical protein IH898_06215 [Planctomycetes bacterium]|nr:hypothetical protein [Planctomycetota bacterium]